MKYECLQASITKIFAIPGHQYKSKLKEKEGSRQEGKGKLC